MFNPYGIAVNPGGRLLVADAYNELIREVLAPFRLQIEPTRSGSSILISWDSEIGRKYQVQYRAGLDNSTWNNLGTTITAKTFVTSQTNANENVADPMLYRVLVVQ